MKVHSSHAALLLPWLLLSFSAPSAPSAPVSSGGPGDLSLVQGQELEAFHAEVTRAFEDLAAWCQSKKLYLQRDVVYRDLLRIDPDNRVARKGLGFKRDKKGGWEQGRHREPKDRGSKEELAAVATMRRDACAALANRMDRLLGKEDLEGRQREAALLFVLDPSNAAVNRSLGRVQDRTGAWRDPEELADELRKEEIEAALDEARSRPIDIEPWKAEAPASQVGLAFQGGFQAERVRVTGTVGPEELHGATEASAFVQDLLQRVLPPPSLDSYPSEVRNEIRNERGVPSHGRFTFYLLASKSEIPVLLRAFPGTQTMSEADLIKTNTGFLDKYNSIGVWADSRAKRLDNLVRQIVGVYFRDEFRINTKTGWVWEGFGIYLTHLAVGTRLTFYVRPSKYTSHRDLNFDQRLLDGDSDWLLELTLFAAKGKRPRLPFLLGRDVNKMELGDLLLANALAAYLFEERPDNMQRILQRVGGGEASALVLEQELTEGLLQIENEVYAFAAGE